MNWMLRKVIGMLSKDHDLLLKVILQLLEIAAAHTENQIDDRLIRNFQALTGEEDITTADVEPDLDFTDLIEFVEDQF